MTLSEKQQKFTVLVARLILWGETKGYKFTFGEAFRTVDQAAINAKKGIGIKNSLHTKRLAVDLNLFINGQYQTDGSAHKPIGEYWESLSTPEYTCCWGGRFGDGNHYSIEDGGVK